MSVKFSQPPSYWQNMAGSSASNSGLSLQLQTKDVPPAVPSSTTSLMVINNNSTDSGTTVSSLERGRALVFGITISFFVLTTLYVYVALYVLAAYNSLVHAPVWFNRSLFEEVAAFLLTGIALEMSRRVYCAFMKSAGARISVPIVKDPVAKLVYSNAIVSAVTGAFTRFDLGTLQKASFSLSVISMIRVGRKFSTIPLYVCAMIFLTCLSQRIAQGDIFAGSNSIIPPSVWSSDLLQPMWTYFSPGGGVVSPQLVETTAPIPVAAEGYAGYQSMYAWPRAFY